MSSISSNVERRNRRLRLLAINPHCYWCGKKVRGYKRQGPWKDDEATIDHLYDKKAGPRPKQGVRVLACWPCNRQRNILTQKFYHDVRKMLERKLLASGK